MGPPKADTTDSTVRLKPDTTELIYAETERTGGGGCSLTGAAV